MTDAADVTWSTEIVEVLCFCCYEPLPVKAKTLLCPPCAQSLSAAMSGNRCTLHKKPIPTELV